MKEIKIIGARTHNLKNININIPRDKLVVITGLSGSGKSSLAFDTIYAEGQRRYIESLSSYARQFLGQLAKPDVDHIEGLSPTISIDQKATNRSVRSTVGTATEIYDYLRLLYARVGIVHCPVCYKEIHRQSVDQIVQSILSIENGSKIQVLSPVVRGQKGEQTKVFEQALKDGFVRARVDKEMHDLSESIPNLPKQKKHDVEIVIDRLVIKEGIKSRLSDSVEIALKISDGLVLIDVDSSRELQFSQHYACYDCGVNIEESEPRMFSFNSPFGACPNCLGLGSVKAIDVKQVILDRDKSCIDGGMIDLYWLKPVIKQMLSLFFEMLFEHYDVDINTPIKDLPYGLLYSILYGQGEEIRIMCGSKAQNVRCMGVMGVLSAEYDKTRLSWIKNEIESMMTTIQCPDCKSARLKKESLAVRIDGLNIYEVCCLSIDKALKFFQNLKLDQKRATIAKDILKEIESRLSFLNNVGLSYLTLSRASKTLSGGESQRIRLATQIGSGLVGVLYVLDEPSIGLHQRDNEKLIGTLKRLRDLGNTLIVVEHDEETMYEADHIVDIGPKAGAEGGHLVVQGTLEQVKSCPDSITGMYLSGVKKIEIPAVWRQGNGHFLEIIGAEHNNLKRIDVTIPLGTFTILTGVSGSGKSSLAYDVMYKSLANHINGADKDVGKHKEIRGFDHIVRVINVDQAPIGRTPRSNAATYVGLFNEIRNLFASTPEAKMRGYKAGRFSFNVRGGRCESCSGDGIVKIEMHFLPDVFVPCDVCKGMRYNSETLKVEYKGKNIHEVLNMTVKESFEFFAHVPRIKNKLQALMDVGLNYIQIGQSSTTLSGGEAQRVKLATELSRAGCGSTLYILDEPTTGLHIDDVDRLIKVLQRLVDAGNTVVVIEHNLDVIKSADYIVDLGPEGGDRGGEVLVCGTPREIANCKKSYTGAYLKKIL